MGCGIADFGMLCALGTSVSSCATALFSERLPQLSHRTVVGGRRVPVFEVSDIPTLPMAFGNYDCRNNRLAFGCYRQIEHTVARYIKGIDAKRVGVVLGSSTSGLDASEAAFQLQKRTGAYPEKYSFHTQHAMGSLPRFIAALCGAKGPVYTISTACSSAAKAMMSAKGLIDANICDVVITGGVDALCDLTVNGFAALGQLSDSRTNPLSINRCGLNIGEGGALFVLTKEESPIYLLGGGESMDAYHMSAPHPEGVGAALAMTRALENAGVSPESVAYVNLHGTATKANDAMEIKAVHRVTPHAKVSSSKPFLGHCLGAAGALETAVCCISLCDNPGRLPAHIFDGELDPDLPPVPLALPQNVERPQNGEDYCYLCNSFAFGGNNCTLVLGPGKGGLR